MAAQLDCGSPSVKRVKRDDITAKVGSSKDFDGGDDGDEIEDTDESSSGDDPDSDDSISLGSEDADDEDEDCRHLTRVETKAMRLASLRAATSLDALCNFYRRIGTTIPDVPLELISTDNATIGMLCAIVRNRNTLQYTPVSYHSCEIVLIPPEFDDPTKSFLTTFLTNFPNPKFRAKIFSDSSTTFGPCPYHSVAQFRDSSAVTYYVKKGWIAYFIDKTWGSGACHQDNKEDALFDQMRGKTAGIIRKMRKQTPQVEKIEWINKHLGNKGCSREFKDEDVVEACKVAMHDDIPEFIMKSQEADWFAYNPLARKVDQEDGSEEKLESEDELDEEEFDKTEYNVVFGLSSKQIEAWKSILAKRTADFEDLVKNRVLQYKILVTVCIALNGPMRNRDVTTWLSDNFIIEAEARKKYQTGYQKVLHQSKKGSKKHWFRSDANPHAVSTIHFFRPEFHQLINKAIKKWREKYGNLIQQKLKNKELWNKIMLLEVDLAGLKKIELKYNVIFQSPDKPAVPPKKYGRVEQKVITSKLPLENLLAVAFLQKDSMQVKEITQWLSHNFDHLRHFDPNGQSGYATISRALKSQKWFKPNGKPGSYLLTWSFTNTENGDIIKTVREWISTNIDAIKEQARNKEILDYMLGI